MVPVRAHLFTSHAYVSPCSHLAMWILIYIHISPLPVALHPNTFPVGFAVCVSLHPSLIWPRLWAEETSTWVSPLWIPSFWVAGCRSQTVQISLLIIFEPEEMKAHTMKQNYRATVRAVRLYLCALKKQWHQRAGANLVLLQIRQAAMQITLHSFVLDQDLIKWIITAWQRAKNTPADIFQRQKGS